jgi:acyl-CoA dehydrogenase
MATTTPKPAPSFALTEDQVQLRDWVHDFAERVVRPAAEEWDEREETPWPIIQEAAKIGLYSFEFLHTSFGDESGLTMPVVNEELFWGDAGIGLSIFGTHLASAAIFANGTPEQMLEWIPRCFGTPDDVKLGAFAITEPDAGSDVASLRTRAKRDGDDWIINGTKCFITNGGIADVHVVVATVDPELGHGGHATFVIEKDAKGLSQGAKHKKLGIHASHTAEVVLENVRVPMENLLGGYAKLEHKMARARERLNAAAGQNANGNGSTANAGSADKGHSGALRTLELSRPTVGAQAVGIARAAYEYALDYATTRVQFNKPIISNQAISFLLADMATEIEAARMLCWHAAWMGRNAQEFDKAQGSMAKLKAGEVANWVTDQAISICGGWGYVRELPVQRWHRDAKIYTLFEGTREIQRRVIARAISKGASESQ